MSPTNGYSPQFGAVYMYFLDFPLSMLSTPGKSIFSIVENHCFQTMFLTIYWLPVTKGSPVILAFLLFSLGRMHKVFLMPCLNTR